MKKFVSASLFSLALAALGANAATVTFTGAGSDPNGRPLAAFAEFNFSGNNLTITLRNTAPVNPAQDASGSTLSGLFFDLTGSPLLTPISALVASGSTVVQAAQCDVPAVCSVPNLNVGGEWGYQATAFPGGADRGIASSGYLTTGLSGNLGNFNGADIDGPASLDGINFAIISAASGFDPNGGLANDPLVRDTVTFVLSGVSGLTIDDVSNVSFQYGTALTEARIPGDEQIPPVIINTPEPGTLALIALSLVGFGAMRRRAI